MAWTKEQSDAIYAKTGNLLVSAAAGSGKTAVLVERIIERVVSGENPIDIDSIVVVTFTKAAAEEMKARLATAFEKLLDENSGNRHLIRQISLLDNAKITTIDSFCSYILRNYYNAVDMEPNFRIAEQGELNLIKEDIITQMIEEHFAAEDEKFADFMDAFVAGKKLDGLSGLIGGLYNFAQSNPWPKEWLRECSRVYSVSDSEEYEKLPIVRQMVEYIRLIANDCVKSYQTMFELCNEPDGPLGYMKALGSDEEQLREIADAKSYSQLAAMLSNIQFINIGRDSASSVEQRDAVKNMREAVKKRIAKLAKEFGTDIDRQVEQIADCGQYVNVLIDLTVEFLNKLMEYKRAKNLLDFSDVEHLALDILISKEDGKIIYSQIADELSESFNEIYIDEYQDSNLVQEYILNEVSKERFGEPNIFMVGDVKQSIYRFRMAKPELFMDKYDRYPTEEGAYRKIELHKNFRSRPNVLNSINDVFFEAMKRAVGGIDYTKDVQLNSGSIPEEEYNDTTEIYYANTDEYKEEDISSREICAHIAADKIQKLMAEDANLRYGDIVILLRSDKASGPVYASILMEHGIPAVYSSTTGYFSSPEIRAVLDLLSVIDNPRQEIPLAGVMRSYFAYFTAEELALIKGPMRKTQLYDCIKETAKQDSILGEKCQKLINTLTEYREQSQIYTITEMLSKIIYGTGYCDYCSALTGGKIKKANLDMLIVKAGEYEKTSYTGIFNFIRYIEKLQKYDVDYGEAQTETDENVIRIMSIHHSKGLEFPVVIIGDMAKKFNLRDTTAPIIYDDLSGIGITNINIKTRIKTKPVYKNMIANKMKNDSIGEEIRILYVAMTRAVNKLIMIGAGRESKQKRWESLLRECGMNAAYINESDCYADLVIPVAMKTVKTGRFLIEYPDRAYVEAIAANVIQSSTEQNETKNIASLALEGKISEEIYREIKERLEYNYPHSGIFSLRAKYSVSELKHKAMEEDELLESAVVSPEQTKPIPEFIEHKAEVSGVFRGNAYHKFFEIFDYNVGADTDSIKAMLENMVSQGRISDEYAKLIDIKHFVKFLEGSLGHAMKNAALNGLLFREQPFIMEIASNEVDASYPPDEKVLIQGIIDAFYFENDKIYIVDYKTDRVPNNEAGEQILISRYQKQLLLYIEALSKITNKKMGACYIYSVCLDKKIEITGELV